MHNIYIDPLFFLHMFINMGKKDDNIQESETQQIRYRSAKQGWQHP